MPVSAAAGTVTATIGWDPSADQVAGYEFCYGTSSGNYDYVVDVGNNTSCTVSGLEEGTTYYFAVKAYTLEGLKSEFSEQLVHTVPVSNTGGGGDANNSEITIEAEEMSVHTNGAQSGGDWLLWSNGSMDVMQEFPETGIYRFEITARGDLANGTGPEMELLIDGVSKGTVFVNTTVHDVFVFDVEIAAGAHKVAVAFKNDYYNASLGIDRNLYVDNIVIYLVSPGDTAQENIQQDEGTGIIAIEAENGNLSHPMSYAWDRDASSEGFIWIPDGSGNSWNPDQESGYAGYTFKVPITGDYVIWGHVKAISGNDDSFYVSVDDGGFALWDTQQSQSWVWDRVKNRNGADPVVYKLIAGEHTLKIKQREDGTKIDKIIITNDPNYVPVELGPNPDLIGESPAPSTQNAEPTELKLYLEAENGKLSNLFESVGDSSASSGQFVWVPNGTGNSWDPNADSAYIEYDFQVPAAGDYVVWGLVGAKNSSDNSFFAAIDDGAYSLWDTKKSNSWVWDPVSDRGGSDPVIYRLEAGAHTLTIKHREDGTKIDRILITNDLEYHPE